MLKFRPHHFLCTLGFRGKGYSEEFVRAFQRIADELRGSGGDDVLIEVVTGVDEICRACPNRREKTCETQGRVSGLDQAHSNVLGWMAGERVTWGEAKNRIREKMTIEKFHATCADCPWMGAGLCEAALRELLDEKKGGGREK